MTKDDLKEYTSSFNPCFNGYYTFTEEPAEVGEEDNEVSILVLMDITLLHSKRKIKWKYHKNMFQSLF